MSVLQRVTGWLSGKGSNNAQTAYGGYKPHGYYGSPQAEDAYGSMVANRSSAAPEESYSQDPYLQAERFSAGTEDPYNGRVPYRSQRDLYTDQGDAQQYMQPDDMRHRRTDAQQNPYPQQETYQQPGGNVVDFPGQQVATPTHVEYVILLRSRNECTKVIEYIKTNASVFLNMEYIANQGERQRCVDMLSGAAYTLGCQLHKISNRGIYLIASPYVRVMIDPAMKRFASTPEAQQFTPRQTGEYPSMGMGMQAERQPLAPAPSFTHQMNGQADYAAAPYPQQASYPQQAPQQQVPQQQAPQRQMQQEAVGSFQRPKPSFQSQTQAEPYRRAAGGQYFNRQPASN